MRNFFLLILLFPTLCYGEPQISQEYNFSKGLNLNFLATEIGADQSPDMCNCVSEPIGASSIRKGTERVFSQAVSSFPVTSIFKTNASTGIENTLLFTNKNSIYYTTGGVVPIVFKATDSLVQYDDFKWLQMDGKAILLGGYENDIKEFDPVTKSVSNLFSSVSLSTGSVYVRAKHGIVSRGYLILSNVQISTSSRFETEISTKYPSRSYFSDLNKRSSFTVFNKIAFSEGDGDEITGNGSINGNVNVFKPTRIQEIAFTILDFTPDGDVITTEIVGDFGLRSPKSLVNSKLYYVFSSDEGIRIWNGGRSSRLNPSDESRTISDDIKILINRLIRSGTYSGSTMIYYPKKEWLVFSYADPRKNPINRNNSILIYDFKISQWFPICGIAAQSFGLSKDGALLYGDNDGYVVEMDKYNRANDMRKEMPIDVMDSTISWVNSAADFVNVKTGTASLSLSVSASVTQSSITRMNTFNFGEWRDKTKIDRSDKLSFKAYVDGLPSLTSLRVDLEVNVTSNTFDSNFTSITIPSSMFSGNQIWTTFEIPLSSFPIRPDWTSFESETIPFANSLFFYGIRFVLNGVETSTVSIDDLRIVQSSDENPIDFYRFTKLFDLGTPAEKNIGGMLLTMEKSPTSDIGIDIYNNFGSKTRTETIPATLPREIFIVNYTTGIIAAIDSVDFSVKRSTPISDTANQFYGGIADPTLIWLNDRKNNQVKQIDRNTFVQVSTFGSFGSGSTNFNLIHETARNSNLFASVDQGNQKIKIYNTSNNTFVREIGGLGSSTNTHKFHQPTAITMNENSVFVADEGNYRWTKFNISTMGFNLSVDIDYNTLGETTFALDGKFIYAAYISGVENSLTGSEIILEKRDINNYKLIAREIIKPKNFSPISAYGHSGGIAILGKYIFIVFNDNEDNANGANYYIQKRLTEDFTLVKEKIFPRQRMYSAIGDSYAYKPRITTKQVDLKTDGRFIQLKYYGNSLDNDTVLYKQNFLVETKPQGY